MAVEGPAATGGAEVPGCSVESVWVSDVCTLRLQVVSGTTQAFGRPKELMEAALGVVVAGFAVLTTVQGTVPVMGGRGEQAVTLKLAPEGPAEMLEAEEPGCALQSS